MKYLLLILIFFISCNKKENNFDLVSILEQKYLLNIPIYYYFDFSNVDIIKVKAKITSYKNVEQETDSFPNITASGRFVYEGSCAISRDIKTKYNVKFGDIVFVKNLNRFYIIEDVTSEKIKNTIDIFVYKHKKHLPTIHSEVYIIKFKNS